MAMRLSEVQNESEFGDLVKVEWEGYSSPYNGFWEILKGPSVEECTSRQWSWHTATSGSHWLKVTDSKSGNIIGGGEWIVHKTNPFMEEHPPITCYWLPEGELKTMGDQMMAAFFSGRPHRMNRPHLLVNYCFVLPQHRRNGAARMFMHWGCQMADEMGLEAFVESTEDGRALYEAFGFVVVNKFILNPQIETVSESWLRLKAEYQLPQCGWFMWRPKGGKFEAGKTKFSWEE